MARSDVAVLRLLVLQDSSKSREFLATPFTDLAADTVVAFQVDPNVV